MEDVIEYEIYDEFAEVYDELMDNIEYDKWTDYIEELLKGQGVNGGIILDMACGTGEITIRLAKKGYDMMGLDISENMLLKAREKDGSILYLNQDMRDMELYGTVAGAICICDGMNYLTDRDDFVKVIRNINNYLDPSAPFIFDYKTEYFYENVLGNRTIVEDRDDVTMLWYNEYQKAKGINKYIVTTFRELENGDYRRSDELHEQKTFTLSEIKGIIDEGGMEFVDAYDAFTNKPVTEKTERMYIIAREKYQEGKYYKKD
ncbi:MAG: class I SAM-dependent methyltransferase [Lachnospiraceae bacterium]|nr:class I SAM-dependent methyltransferase [Lachnospiraceae bacterium]